jgi:hypothetical protein
MFSWCTSAWERFKWISLLLGTRMSEENLPNDVLVAWDLYSPSQKSNVGLHVPCSGYMYYLSRTYLRLCQQLGQQIGTAKYTNEAPKRHLPLFTSTSAYADRPLLQVRACQWTVSSYRLYCGCAFGHVLCFIYLTTHSHDYNCTLGANVTDVFNFVRGQWSIT